MTTLIPPETWNTILDEVAEAVLSDTGSTARPVDALKIARRLGIPVALDAAQPERGRLKQLSGQASIFLKPEVRPERLQWAAAHELGELVAWRVFDRLSEEEDASIGLREPVANLLASRLLLPGCWFYDDVRRHHGDLLALKKIYHTASHELIACRMLDLPEPTIITIFDHGSATRRRTNGFAQAPKLQLIERHCWKEVHRTNRSVELSEQGLSVQAWPVHEPGWKREILRTTFLDCDVEGMNQETGWD